MTSDEDLREDYENAGFGARIGFGDKSAVVVVDFVDAYLIPDSPLYAGIESAVPPARRLVSSARSAGVPVIYTRVELTEAAAAASHFVRKIPSLRIFVGDGPFGRITADLAPLPHEAVLIKEYASAFHGTDLARLLTDLEVDTVVICGLSTSGCVRATAVDAMQNGFRPIVAADAVGDRDAGPHSAALFDLDAKYADVMSVQEVVAQWQG